MLVLLSTLWLACAVLRGQGTAARRDSVIIFNNISCLSVCSVIHLIIANTRLAGFLVSLLAFRFAQSRARVGPFVSWSLCWF